MQPRWFPCFATLGLAFLTLGLSGCACRRSTAIERQSGESVVCIGEQPAALAFLPLPGRPVTVRSGYEPGPDVVTYEPGRDYAIDPAAEVVLFSAFPPNPKWKFGSQRMDQFAAATGRVARETRCAFADVYGNWVALAARKKPEDLLGNNINHPNDFGHWMYFRVLTELGL